MKVFTVTTTKIIEHQLNTPARVRVTASKEEARKFFKEDIRFELDCIKHYGCDYYADFEEDDKEVETKTIWNSYSESCTYNYKMIIVLQEHEI